MIILASDFVKFTFTMAFSITMLAWGLLSHQDAYDEAGQYDEALSAIRWGSDYFIKCHTGKYEFYGQVGDFFVDHDFWGRPEDMNMTRPAYKIDIKHPGNNKRSYFLIITLIDIFASSAGSDLASEAAASLAATSLVFRHRDKEYANEVLKHAKELYQFANQYRGLSEMVIPGAESYYK